MFSFSSPLFRFTSNRSQTSLWHGKDIRTGYQYCFSGKGSKRTFKPNAHFKKFYSDILQRWLRINVTTTALDEINTKGSIDNYIMTTPSIKMRSKLGDNLKEIMQKKLDDPNLIVPHITGTKSYQMTKAKRHRLRRFPNKNHLGPNLMYYLPPELRWRDKAEWEITPEFVAEFLEEERKYEQELQQSEESLKVEKIQEETELQQAEDIKTWRKKKKQEMKEEITSERKATLAAKKLEYDKKKREKSKKVKEEEKKK